MTFALLTKKELTTKIGGIAKRASTLRQDIHETLCHAAGHALEHGDVTSFTRLFTATSGMARKEIAAWVAEFGFARLQKDGSYKLDKQARKDAIEQFRDGAACAEYLLAERKWYESEMNAEQVVNALDIAKRIEGVAKAIENAMKKGQPITADARDMNKATAHLKLAYAKLVEQRTNREEPCEEPCGEAETPAPLMIAAE